MEHPSRLIPFTFVLALLQALPAQRDERVLKARGGQVTIEYGAVIVGSHGLHELRPGRPWRMGSGDPSKLVTYLPLISGDVVVMPGSYPAQILRIDEDNLKLSLGSARFGGMRGGSAGGNRRQRGGGGGAGAQLDGLLSMPKKKSKKLILSWAAARSSSSSTAVANASNTKSKRKGVKNCTLQIDFGAHRLDIPLQVVEATKKKVQKFSALCFTYPVDVFRAQHKAGEGVAVLSLLPRKTKKGAPLVGFNVVVGPDSAEVVAMATVAAGARAGRARGGRGGGRGGAGRGDRRGGDAGGDAAAAVAPRTGSVEWTAYQGDGSGTVSIQSIKASKQELTFEVLAGDKLGKVKVPLPTFEKPK